MKGVVAVAAFLFGAGGLASAADDKLDEKFLVGAWTIKYVNPKSKPDAGKPASDVKKAIEFKADGTYLWEIAGSKMEGTYKLKGTTLELTKKGTTGATVWKDLSIKDGKLIQPVGKETFNELTRAEKK